VAGYIFEIINFMYPSPYPLPCFARKGAKSLNICGFIPLLAKQGGGLRGWVRVVQGGGLRGWVRAV